jgi:hypothetical protein
MTSNDVPRPRYRDPNRIRKWLLVVASLALLAAAGAFTYSLGQVSHLAAQNRAITAKEAFDSRRHCLGDVRQDTDRRTLDQALITADRRALIALYLLAAHPHDETDAGLIRVQIAYYHAALDARLDNVPPKRSAANC